MKLNKIMNYIFLTISISLLAFSAWGQEKAITKAKYEHKETSESLTLNSVQLDWRNHRRDSFWPYTGSLNKSQDFGFVGVFNKGDSNQYEFNGQKLKALYGRQVNANVYWEMQGGFHQVKGKNIRENIKNKTAVFSGELKLKHEDSIQKFIFDYDLAYEKLQMPAGINQNLRVLNLSYFINYNFSQRHRLSSSVAKKIYSGKNARDQFDVTYMFKENKSEWMPWIGIGMAYLSTDKHVVGYWSPRTQVGYGPRIEWSYWHSDFFSASLESQVDRYYDATVKKLGWGHYTALNFYLGDRNEMHGQLGIVRMDSSQNGGDWSESDFLFSFSRPF